MQQELVRLWQTASVPDEAASPDIEDTAEGAPA